MKRRILFFILFASFAGMSVAQEMININSDGGAVTLRAGSRTVKPEGALQCRAFEHNRRLLELTEANQGDVLLLDFFDDKKYRAEISRVTGYPDGTVGITAQIMDTRFATCFIVVSNTGITLIADLPEKDEQYRAVVKKDRAMLTSYKLSEVHSKNKNGTCEALPAPVSEKMEQPKMRLLSTDDIEEAVTIDLMVVYTKEAREWADNSEMQNIDDAIKILLDQQANEVMRNSKTNVSFRVVHTYETDYHSENDIAHDLDTIIYGYINDVHYLRRIHQADLVVFLHKYNNPPGEYYTAGIAYTPHSPALFDVYNNCGAGYVTCDIKDAFEDNAAIHEIGHTLGCGHHFQQNVNEGGSGPGPGLFPYSSGYKAIDDENEWFCTVMAYKYADFYSSNPQYYHDAKTILYFSTPDMSLSPYNVPIGDEHLADNALTIKKTKHTVSRYSDMLDNMSLTVDVGVLVPEFDPEIKNYWVNVPTNVYSIIISRIFNGSTLFSNKYDLDSYGTRAIPVYVANAGYTVNVNYASPTASSDATLKSITPSTTALNLILHPAFDPSVTHYTVLAPYSTDHIFPAGEPNDRNALVKISGRKELTVGVNTLELDVYAEDGKTTKKYVVDVIRPPQDNPEEYWTLSSLSVDEGAIHPAFDPLVKSYTVEVPGETAEVNIHATPTNSSHSVAGTGTFTLDSNLKRFYIQLYDESGNICTYELDVKRVEIPVTSISITESSVSMTVGDTKILTYTVEPENATDKTVSWSSDKPDVADVDMDGKITAKKAGTAIITATAGTQTATCTVTVTSHTQCGSILESGIAGNLAWELCENGQLTIFGTGDMENYSLGGPWYTYRAGITKVIVEEGVKSIGSMAFNACSDITSVSLPSTLTDMNANAFADCSSLTSIDIPNSVTSIGSGAFLRCTNLTSIVITNSVISIGEYTFEETGLTSVEIPNSVTSIGQDAFSYCPRLTSVVIPNSVISIGYYTFYYCSSLKDFFVNWGNPLNVNPNVFWDTSISQCTLHVPVGTKALYEAAAVWGDFGSIVDDVTDQPENVPVTGVSLDVTSYTSIVNQTFRLTATVSPDNATNKAVAWSSDHTNVATVSDEGLVTTKATGTAKITVTTADGNKTATCTIVVSDPDPDSDFEIKDGVLLKYRGNRTSVVIPAGVREIGYDIEYYWKNGSMTIPGNPDLDNYAFFNRTKLTSVTIPNSVEKIETLAFAGTALTTLVLPGSLTHIGNFAFGGTGISELAIPNSVKSIGQDAFQYCMELQSVTLPNAITSINDNTFAYCIELSSVTIPESVTSIKYGAFYYCDALGSITIPGNVNALGNYAFGDCGNLKTVTVNRNEPLSIERAVFDNVDLNSCTLYVPAGTKAHYEAAAVWREFGTIVESGPTNTLSVSPSSLAFGVSGGAQTVTVSSGGAWTVGSSASWATVSAASGSGNGTVTVTATANSGNVSRTATITFSGSGLTRTVDVTQTVGTVPPAVSPASVSVSPAELRLEPGGTARLSATVLPANASDQSVTWSSSNGQVAAVSSDGQVTAVSHGIAVITARTGTGNHTGACTVSVEEQSVVAQPVPPAGSRGSIEVSLNVPVNEVFSIFFGLILPAGFTLDQSATGLASELLDSHQLAILPAGPESWLFEINPKVSSRSADETVYQQVVHIVYTLASVAAGNYEASIRNVNLTTNRNGTVVQQDEIKVPITLAYNVGNAAVAGDVRYAGGILTVNTPVAEQITVYSLSGSVMYQAQKAAGEATFNLRSLPRGVFIARGSSGWTKKIVVSG